MERSTTTNFTLTAIAFALIGAGFFAWAHAQVVGVTLPSAPGSVSAVAQATPGQIEVSWAASAESSGTIEGYYVYRNGAQVANTPGTSIVDAGLQAGYYTYTVKAYDANGYQSQTSAPVSLTLVLDTTPPTVPTGVTVTGVTSTNSYYARIPVTISWSASTDNVGVVGYYVYRNGMPITSTTSTQSGTSLTDSVGVGTYAYTVVAYDAAQNDSAPSSPVSVTIAIDSAPPTVPTNVSAQQVSANGVNVTWTTSTDPNGIAGYQIFRNGMQIASAGGSPYADSGLSTNMEYSYNVTAYDVAGNVSVESQPVANVTIQPFNGPSAPIIVGTMLVSTSTVYLSWAPAADPLAITNYLVYRDGAQIKSGTSTNYTDVGLSPGLHIYNLTATDVSGAVSPMSASSTVIVPITSTSTATMTPPPTTSIPTSVTVTAPPVAAGASVTTPASPITQSLYYGLRNAQVTALQTVLVGDGYLSSIYATGFFGNLTLKAIEKFQCNESIVCTGGAGWGIVGPKTRAALNALEGTSTASTTSEAIPSTVPASSMLSEIQTLEAELATLEAKLPAGK